MFLLVEPRFRLWFHLKLRAPPTSRPLNGGRTLWQISPLSLRPSLNIHYYFLPSTTIRYYPLLSTSIHKYPLLSTTQARHLNVERLGTGLCAGTTDLNSSKWCWAGEWAPLNQFRMVWLIFCQENHIWCISPSNSDRLAGARFVIKIKIENLLKWWNRPKNRICISGLVMFLMLVDVGKRL